ncbi:hydantoinase/oxoprolinase family protein (plasmid) [Haloferax mediterranei ATCC 33500]|uniref:Hydantoinase/oxoprolinase family protein n=1 Tax=Haloferax mediterranei (strain ATCC 33500 / DSM 1411 / JCM 8866 / NBRC 14739 / NCIMB 2177 / R-4) TaxID=523841 RepID=I3R9W6_HALMT|nr:hydantoinase/oxoprolinase family protein [Haloferax mediterranei]AFK21026.1 N-methylhydantoinase A (ATP-hydrolyzing) [Haloferax mediterranei ATCC 33500]AHZ24113.1 N-methylhydantoinase [Haloferax mediterranei ATCC 33500]EMA05188.1 N-methylhydantoinase A (ATP-hydrolyzing) [Haloferax mediterranei ATCC 33500]MDX5990004.1 hydantoinase/oxoprolinase family protein [Haloferax mediterranei ATCC 33500]QCQ77187.1 hydantoinase/oxoprolinase family protein [Haloferax mediterranei ATCC 33500]
MSRDSKTQRLAVDIGGTFVDAITFDRETRSIDLEKAATTSQQPSKGVLNSVGKVGASLEETEAFVHGTTLGLNAVLERDGAKTGIITNEGFEDVYEIGRTNLERDAMYDINYQKPASLVPRRRRVGVPGRLNASGAVVEELDTDAVRDAAAYLVDEQGVESIAICFLHSYQNDQHEQAAAQIVRETRPEVSVSVSSDISGEYREYERTSTAVLDGYIKPIFENYVDTLDSNLGQSGFDGSFFITRSGGGTLTAESAKTAPVHTILSGPAGGLIGASHVGNVTGRENLITVDMGGTSLDAAVIEDGSPVVKYDSSLEHQPMMIPVYDIRTIGAGGGSIAWLDGELLKVGPQSAGADPGPICYDNGGTEPTVTDAALALGFLDPNDFLGGEMETAEAAALDGIESKLADPLGMSVHEASKGVFDVALANTVGAIREITVEKGLDPRDFSMVAYGGAGPMFVPLLAREIGVNEVLVPQAPSVFSAWGMLMADVVYDFSQTHIAVLDDIDLETLESEFSELEDEGRETLESEGIEESRQEIERAVEMRYFGQEHTVEVNADGVESIAELAERFEAQHETRYGHTMDDPVQAVHLRVRAVGENDKPSLDPEDPRTEGELEPVGSRSAYCFAENEFVDFDVYQRSDLAPGDELAGPTVVTEPTTSLVFHSDQTATVDEYGHITITTGGDQ